MADDARSLGSILRSMRDRAERDKRPVVPVEPQRQTEPTEEQCPKCSGRGWMCFDVPLDHPDFAKLVPCECSQDEDASGWTSRLQRYSNLGPLSGRTFRSLNPNGLGEDPESRRLFGIAYEAAQSYAAKPSGWLTLTGPNGAGKTHLAAAIANYCIQNRKPVFFVYVPDLLNDLRAAYAPTSDIAHSDLFEQVVTAPLLVLDGLGMQSPTPWAQEKLQHLFNSRANAEMPTVVTTTTDVAMLDPYLASRLIDPHMGRVLAVGSRSYGEAKRLGRVPEPMLARMTFQTFDPRGHKPSGTQRASLQAAFDAAHQFAAEPNGWLSLFGDTGVGKTHLAVAIAVQRAQKGLPAFFAFVPDLMDYLRQTFQPDSGPAYDISFDQIKNVPLLILDDLGGERRTDWAYEKLYQIIVHRHNLRLPTVITSPMELADSAGPLSSRIQDPSVGLLMRIDAPDYRAKRR